MNALVRKRNFLSQSVLTALLLTAAGLSIAAEEEIQSPRAMAELARRYEHGLGCPRDIGRALMYYRRAAAEGEPRAMVALGDLYKEGRCVPQNLQYANGMFRQAAQQGFGPGMARFAAVLEERGAGDEALDWYRKAADAGHGPAMTRLGDLLKDTEWYGKAVAAQDPPAFARLAAHEDEDSARGLLERGAELNDPVAQRLLAMRTLDQVQSQTLLRRSAEAGDAEAAEVLAFRSEEAGNAGDALAWHSRAAELGRVRSRFWLARRVGKPDEALMAAAAAEGDPEALFLLGRINEAARGGHAEALAQAGQIEEAARRQHGPSLLKLGRVQEAAEAGEPEAMYLYGSSLPDRADAMRWIRKAAEARHVAAMRDLSLALETGVGIAANPEEARKWRAAAAQAGDAESLFRLGDPDSLRRAAEAGHKRAQFLTRRLSLEEAVSAGVPEGIFEMARKVRNPREAYRLLVEAADKGYAPAMLLAGDWQLEGRGTSQSEVDAANWYRRAALIGSAEAMERLRKLGKGL